MCSIVNVSGNLVSSNNKILHIFFIFRISIVTAYQWRIQGTIGMARAMGATLTGGAKLLGKN